MDLVTIDYFQKLKSVRIFKKEPVSKDIAAFVEEKLFSTAIQCLFNLEKRKISKTKDFAMVSFSAATL